MDNYGSERSRVEISDQLQREMFEQILYIIWIEREEVLDAG
jgi:hypothetical protein